MKCLFLSLQQLFGALQSKMTVFFFGSKTAAGPRGGKLLGLLRLRRRRQPLRFQSISLPLPSSSQQNVKYLLDFFFLLLLLFDFHVDVISKSCLWLSLCLCSSGRLDVFLKSTDPAAARQKEKEESAVSVERGEEKKRRSYLPPSSPHLSVGESVCAYTCVSVCFSLCQ